MNDRHRSGRGIATGVTAAVISALLGACAGWWAVGLLPPTTADVREAARSLVPPGLSIVSSADGYLGDFPTRGPYSAGVTMEGGGTVEERLAAFRDRLQAEEWRLTETENRPNAVVLRYERGDLTARISVRITDPSSFLGVGRMSEPSLGLRLLCAAVGAAIGVVISRLVRLASSRSAGRHR